LYLHTLNILSLNSGFLIIILSLRLLSTAIRKYPLLVLGRKTGYESSDETEGVKKL
jgi:hypothetical protein